MFQTELIVFLQSFATDWLTGFLRFVSLLGYPSFYIPVLILITFGINFRKGFLLIQTLIWVSLLTSFLKNFIALPRPVHVDTGVNMLEENIRNPAPFTGMGGKAFWGLPDQEVIQYYRANPSGSYGFPSGHVSGTATFWIGLTYLFQDKTIRNTGICMIALMPLSRMYLGQHFLADVIGGFMLAAVILAGVYHLAARPGAYVRLLDLTRFYPAVNASTILFTVYTLLPIAFLALDPLVRPIDAGRMFGMNTAFFLVAMNGLPEDTATLPRRTGRVAIAFTVYLIADVLTGAGVDFFSLDTDHPGIVFLRGAIPAFTVLWAGVALSLMTGLYNKDRRL